MMWEWASSRPQYCVKFGTDSIAWAESHRNWRGRSRQRCLTVPIAEGMVKPSPVGGNVSEPSVVAERLRELTTAEHLGDGGRWSLFSDRPRRITLLLPDAAVRAVVLHLDQLPTKHEERESLIRWRLGQQQLFPVAGTKIVSQIFTNQPGSGGQAYTVLTVSIQESVLSQYESMCESVGLIPQEVGITSLQLFDLWRSTSGHTMWQRQNCLWANLADQALTTMVFQQGRLLFYRCKLLGGHATEGGAQGEMLNRVLEECGASLEVCQQQHPSAVIQKAVVCADGDLSTLQARMESELDLSVEQLGWRAVKHSGWVDTEAHRTITSLAALAGVS